MPYDHPLNVWHTGEVLWVTQAIYKSPCDVKTYNFPFDVHMCNFTFASWTHSELQLNLTFYENQDKILRMSYYDNPQWEIEVGVRYYDNLQWEIEVATTWSCRW